jgi:hypothetical protein
MRLQDYLRANYPYTLDVPSPPPGRDAVDYFLFEAPGGFCSYYASAMAVMLRTQGVAARVVTGYAMGDYEPGRGAYRVPASAAHAWVEVYFPGYAWVEFEPTAARAAFRYPAGLVMATAAAPDADPASVARSQPGWRAALALLVVALAGFIGWLVIRSAGPRGLSPRARALRLYGRMRASLARAGVGATPGLTPAEYQAGPAARLAARPPVAAALARATDLHERAAYSAHPISARELAETESAWRRARRTWARLWLR